MEIREVTQYHPDAPFSGYGVWIIFEQKHRKVKLIHPILLSELELNDYEILKAVGNCLWPFNNSGSCFNIERFTREFKDRIRFFLQIGKSFPVETVTTILAELDGTSIEKARELLQTMVAEAGEDFDAEVFSLNKEDREFALREGVDISGIKGRPLAIIDALKDHGPANMLQITELVEGRLKTKSKLSRVVTYFVNKLASQGILEIVA